MQQRILVIDDDDVHQCVLRKVLDPVCRVVPALTIAEAQAELAKNSFDLILLDVTLPDGDGFSFFAKLKTEESTSAIPVIFITSRAEQASEMMGFSLGAEDYIVKPIDPPRIKSRIEARLRQIQGRKDNEMTLCKGNVKLIVSLQRAVILHDGKEVAVDLRPVEFKLFFHLLRHEDRVFTREQLLTAVWDNAAEVFDRTVDMHISKLRKKIALSNYEIRAVHGMGYRLSRGT